MSRLLNTFVILIFFSCTENESQTELIHVLSEMSQETPDGQFLNEFSYDNGRISSITRYMNGDFEGQSLYSYGDNSYRLYLSDRGLPDSDQFEVEYQFNDSGQLVKVIDQHYSYAEEQYTSNVTISNYSYQSDSIFEERTTFWNEYEPMFTVTSETIYIKDSEGNLRSEFFESQNEKKEYYYKHTGFLSPRNFHTGYQLPQLSINALFSFEYYLNGEKRNEEKFYYETNELGLISKEMYGANTIEYKYKTISNSR